MTRVDDTAMYVSIRSRLFGREILRHPFHEHEIQLFQSAPGCLAGRYLPTQAQ